MTTSDMRERLERAADLFDRAGALLITAGAGMGVDSGLPDFRGDQGFWRAYPALGEAGMRFADVASPRTFAEQPGLVWGFYGHRLKLYRDTVPHDGFPLLRAAARRMPGGAFVMTSNVDGQFQKAGFSAQAIYECHGSIHRLQCMDACTSSIWPASDIQPDVDEATCVWRGPLPRCPTCGSLARPNVLMFDDQDWLSDFSATQARHLRNWLDGAVRLLVVELGAGTSIPTVRHFSQGVGAPVIRINVRESELPAGVPGVSLPLGALEALTEILGT